MSYLINIYIYIFMGYLINIFIYILALSFGPGLRTLGH